MRLEQFNEIVREQLQYCEALLVTKGDEYARADDRLAAFKKAGQLQGETPKQALLGMLSKHLVSIADMCMRDSDDSYGRWTEKITDSINYFLILKAMVAEEMQYEKHRGFCS